MGKTLKHYAKLNKPGINTVKFRETENTMEVASGPGGRRNAKLLFNCYGASV